MNTKIKKAINAILGNYSVTDRLPLHNDMIPGVMIARFPSIDKIIIVETENLYYFQKQFLFLLRHNQHKGTVFQKAYYENNNEIKFSYIYTSTIDEARFIRQKIMYSVLGMLNAIDFYNNPNTNLVRGNKHFDPLM